MEMGSISLKRVFPKLDTDPEIQRYDRVISTKDPFFEKIDAKTVLLRIPRFWISEKRKIDSVINANKKTILSNNKYWCTN